MFRFVGLLLPPALALHVPPREEILSLSGARADASLCLALGGPVESNSSWSHVAAAPEPPPPKQLLFIHMEKMAGGFIEEVTQDALPAGSLQMYHHCGVPPATPPDDYFVMSSMRNPCDQKVSAWSYMCEKTFLKLEHGQYNSAAGLEKEFREGKCPTFRVAENWMGNRKFQPLKGVTVDKNVKGFQDWVNESNVSVLPAFKVYFETAFAKDRVNCWVMYEDMGRTLRHCLEKFENFTGRAVNWTRFEESMGKQEHHHNSTHGHCSEYYTPALREAVRQREMPVMSYFGYTDCCGD